MSDRPVLPELPTLPTDAPPSEPARQLGHFRPRLLLHEDHDLCPGCGEPLAIRTLLEVIDEMGEAENTIGVVGIGCYTAFTSTMDVDLVQALHGRAPSVATGAKRMRPETIVFTLQGDGDMVNEGLQEVLHTAARGESVTCVMLNNGVFGETGGHMTATTVLGQRTKNSLEGRDAGYHGYPILIADLLAPLGGTAYAARGSVHDAPAVGRTKNMLRRALETQRRGDGFSFVEILTMCPTGWFVPTAEGPGYLNSVLGAVHATGELRNAERLVTTAELLQAAKDDAGRREEPLS
ncbi:MAG: thiamine pyrophosphate-dependent enzyme [Proteobacteria bacterium]|nr:thiamine pyrophosphate-dependent enzyme [Pseudomonadota bacterium]MCZ6784433.1 thiamine pyrophosphate-dependent enzyme [Pseudomonadota bacterium]